MKLVNDAVIKILVGDLSKHAISEGNKSLAKFQEEALLKETNELKILI